ncbi:hypothetical protein CCS92_33465, partial [Methylobacterium radiotolerans]
ARALAPPANLRSLDEPTTDLDRDGRRAARAALPAWRAGARVVDPETVRRGNSRPAPRPARGGGARGGPTPRRGGGPGGRGRGRGLGGGGRG